MSEIISNSPRSSNAKRLQAVPRVDLTPMVDLAFLLITFFMLTTSLQKQQAIIWKKPISEGPDIPISECQVLHLLTDSMGNYFYWEGLECNAVSKVKDRAAINNLIREKKEKLKTSCFNQSGNARNVICLLKLLPKKQYQNMVALLDEMHSSKVGTYAIQDYDESEILAVANYYNR